MSCPIQSEDGTIDSIIILGGKVENGTEGLENYPISTEIMTVKDQMWIEGPKLPIGIKSTALVSLPPTLMYACVAIGGYTLDAAIGKHDDNNVYGLDRLLTTWTLLGKLKNQQLWPLGESGPRVEQAIKPSIGFPLS